MSACGGSNSRRSPITHSRHPLRSGNDVARLYKIGDSYFGRNGEYYFGADTQSQLLDSLNAIQAFQRKFNALARVDVLVIDDFGLKPLRPPQDEDLHDLLAERYEQTATIVTSNLDFTEWGDAFPNRLLGAATLDRLRHNAYRLTLEGES